jgi:hypothetical protein
MDDGPIDARRKEGNSDPFFLFGIEILRNLDYDINR